MKIIVCKDYPDMSEKAAELVAELVRNKPDLVFCLPAGSTPIGMFDKLVEYYREGKLDFSQLITFNMDEYVGLAKSDENSYVYFMKKHFFDHVNVNSENINYPQALRQDINSECQRYQELIEAKGGLDLAITGIGDNGHIAFNEPADKLSADIHVIELDEATLKANSRFFGGDVDRVPKQAFTIGMKEIMLARNFLVMASGKNKAAALAKFFENDEVDTRFPLSFIKIHPNATFIIDEEAAGLLSKEKLDKYIQR